MPHRTFTIDEVARYLHLHRQEVDQLVQRQEIPHERQGQRIVFRKLEIDAWASRRILGLEGRSLADYHAKTTVATRLRSSEELLVHDMMSPKFIVPELGARTKSSVLREMAVLAQRTGRVIDAEALLEGLRQREELCPTALPGGWALLHARHPDPYLFEEPILVLSRSVQLIPFGAADHRPTDLFFLLGCPDDGLHLHALARLCLMAQKTDVLAQLRAANSSEAMFRALVEAEIAVTS